MREARETTTEIFERMDVVDADDQYVGIVQKVEKNRIELIKDKALDPRHPFVDKSQVAAVENNRLKLSQKISAITTRAFVSPERGEEKIEKA